jgi:hypothetical protein
VQTSPGPTPVTNISITPEKEMEEIAE